MNLLQTILPFLDIAAVFAGVVTLMATIMKATRDLRVKKHLVRFARGNIIVQQSLKAAWADRVVDEDEARQLRDKLLLELERSPTVSDSNAEEMRLFISEIERTRGKRFYTELAEDTELKRAS